MISKLFTNSVSEREQRGSRGSGARWTRSGRNSVIPSMMPRMMRVEQRHAARRWRGGGDRAQTDSAHAGPRPVREASAPAQATAPLERARVERLVLRHHRVQRRSAPGRRPRRSALVACHRAPSRSRAHGRARPCRPRRPAAHSEPVSPSRTTSGRPPGARRSPARRWRAPPARSGRTTRSAVGSRKRSALASSGATESSFPRK